jgi:hypothetical protein
MTETKKTVQRRDGAGHLNPEYEKKLMDDLRENHPPKDDDRAFLTRARSAEDISEELGENFVASATSGEAAEPERQDSETEEEQGGPFIETSAAEEFAEDTEDPNIPSATREPFPRTQSES